MLMEKQKKVDSKIEGLYSKHTEASIASVRAERNVEHTGNVLTQRIKIVEQQFSELSNEVKHLSELLIEERATSKVLRQNSEKNEKKITKEIEKLKEQNTELNSRVAKLNGKLDILMSKTKPQGLSSRYHSDIGSSRTAAWVVNSPAPTISDFEVLPGGHDRDDRPGPEMVGATSASFYEAQETKTVS